MMELQHGKSSGRGARPFWKRPLSCIVLVAACACWGLVLGSSTDEAPAVARVVAPVVSHLKVRTSQLTEVGESEAEQHEISSKRKPAREEQANLVSEVMAGVITMRPSSSIFVDLFTPDSSYTCRALRVLSKNAHFRALGSVSAPLPISVPLRRMQATNHTVDEQSPFSPYSMYYGYYYPYYSDYAAWREPLYQRSPEPRSTTPSPPSATANTPPSAPGAPEAREGPQAPVSSPKLAQDLPDKAGSAGAPTHQKSDEARDNHFFGAEDASRTASPPGVAQQPPPTQPAPPSTPPEGIVRHPITLPIGTTVTAPVTIPVTLPITSPSLSPLTIAFPVEIPGIPTTPWRPQPPPPPAPTPEPVPRPPSPPPNFPPPYQPPPYYPYPPYYPPRPRPPTPGYPNPYPTPPAPAPPSPPRAPGPPQQPDPYPPQYPSPYPWQPTYPRPPSQPPSYPNYPPQYPGQPQPPQYPAPGRPPADDNAPLPSPVPERPSPNPRRPGRGGGNPADEHSLKKVDVGPRGEVPPDSDVKAAGLNLSSDSKLARDPLQQEGHDEKAREGEVKPDGKPESAPADPSSQMETERREYPHGVGREEKRNEAREGEVSPVKEVKSPLAEAFSEAEAEGRESPDEVRNEVTEGEVSPDRDAKSSAAEPSSQGEAERRDSPQAVEHGVKRDEPNEEVSPDRHVKSPALGAPSEADAERRESPEEVGHEEEPDEASEGETLPGGDVKSPALGAPSEADTERTESPEEVREEETQDEASEGEASPDTDGGISPLGAPSEADTERSESPEEAGHERRHEDRGDGVARNRDVDEAAEKPSPEMEAGKPEYPSVAVAFSSSPSADTRAPRETGTALVPPRKTDGPARKQTAEGLPPHSAGHKEDSAAVVASPLQGLFFNVDRAASAGSSDTPLNREGIIFNPTVIDQLIAAIAAQVENRDGSAPLFLPSICPACKVEIVTYAPIHLPDIGEGREFERARQQLNYLQARHTPQDFPEESRDNAEPSRPRAPVDGMSRTAGVASFIRVESAQSPSTPATAQSQSSTLESSSVLEPPEARDLPQDLQQTVTAVQTRAGDSRESTSSENRRKRPKELRGLSTDTRNTQAVVLQEGGLSRVSSSLKASRPTKHEIAPSADDPKPPGVHRSRLEAGEEEGVFVVMFACFPEGKGDTSLMVANLEVRVSSEMPTPVTA